jgi:hypothetical protein
MRVRRTTPLLVFPLFVLSLLSCTNPAATRQLLSVTISPTFGAGQGSPGQVQFVATGTYNTEPYTVTPLEANWGVTSYPQAIATTTQSGLATCNQGGSGATTIEAWVAVPHYPQATCDVIDSAGRPACDSVGGSAQLTCQ